MRAFIIAGFRQRLNQQFLMFYVSSEQHASKRASLDLFADLLLNSKPMKLNEPIIRELLLKTPRKGL